MLNLFFIYTLLLLFTETTCKCNDNESEPSEFFKCGGKGSKRRYVATEWKYPLELSNHASQKDCRRCVPSGRIILSPCKTDNIVRPAYNSVSLRCTVCQAIAKEIEQKLSAVIQTSICYSPTELSEILTCSLNTLCTAGFAKHDLRNFSDEDEVLITDSFNQSTHVASDLDGQWPQKLRSVCVSYVKHLNVISFYESYKADLIDIEEFLCRGNGIFRDCKNLI